jgi:arsenate reductase (thioredoxin)
MSPKTKVLLLSTHDSTRSQMAEGFLKKMASDKFEVASAAIESTGADPLGAEVMKEAGVDTSSQTSLDVKQSIARHFGYVIVLYDASNERSPVFPFTTNLLRWSIPDPAAAAEASPAAGEAKKNAFRRVRDDIGGKVRSFVESQERAARAA